MESTIARGNANGKVIRKRKGKERKNDAHRIVVIAIWQIQMCNKSKCARKGIERRVRTESLRVDRGEDG